MTHNNIGNEKIIELDSKIIEKIFPANNNVNYDDIQISDVGKYSISSSNDANKISKIIEKNINKDAKDIIVTDGTSGIGGNVISFCKYFKFVNAVELSPLHCKILNNNVIKVYNYNNVNIICKDYTTIYNTLAQDAIFLDPPWGGPNYKDIKKLDLYLGDHNLVDFINDIQPYAKLIVIKVPYNFNINKLIRKCNFTKRKLYKFKKYYIIALIN